MTRVVFLTSSTERRGAEVAAVALAAALAERGHDTEVLALRACPGRGADHGAEPVPGGIGPGGLWHLHRRCRAADVVVGYGGRTLPVGRGGDGRRAVRVPEHRRPGRLDHHGGTTPPGPDGLRRASRVVALWADAAAAFEQSLHVDPARTAVIPTGFDTDAFRRRPVRSGPRHAPRWTSRTAGVPDDRRRAQRGEARRASHRRRRAGARCGAPRGRGRPAPVRAGGPRRLDTTTSASSARSPTCARSSTPPTSSSRPAGPRACRAP